MPSNSPAVPLAERLSALRRSRAARWLLPVVFVGAAVALKEQVAWLGRDPDLLFLLAVMATASIGGLGPGLAATALAALAQLHFFIAPLGSLWIDDAEDGVLLAVWTMEGVLISVLAGNLRRTREEAIASAAELTRQAAALELARAGLEQSVIELSKSNADFRAEFDQRIRSEAALDRAELAARVAYNVLQNQTEGCQVVGFDWTYLYVNDAVCKQGGVPSERLVGQTVTAAFPGIDETSMFVTLHRCMTDRAHGAMESESLFPGGPKGCYELRFVPVPEGVCILSTDITGRRRLEEQFRQAQKMEAVGRLAGGVAHDFNNLLSIILSYAEMTIQALSPGDPLREDVLEIEKAGERAAELTAQLLAFSRQQVVSPRVLDLNASVARMDKMLGRLLGADVVLRTLPGAELGRVMADPGQLEQIVMNLAVNARDAMPDGGQLTIETANVDLDDEFVLTHVGATSGPHVMLSVTDTGVGMDEATQQHIFEPFFTTKEVGRGTGLGLSTVMGIVRQSRGTLWVSSEVGKGATFTAYFPRTEDPLATAARPSQSPPRRASATILVVEDEDPVRLLVGGILRKQGYGVLSAANSVQAIATSEQYAGRIDVLLTDIIMPGMNGRQLAESLGAIRPEMRVLYMSGYTGDVLARHTISDGTAAFLQKPLNPAALLRKLEEVLDAPSREMPLIDRTRRGEWARDAVPLPPNQ